MIKELPGIGRVIERAAHVILDLRPGTETLMIPAPETSGVRPSLQKTWGEPFRGVSRHRMAGKV